MKEHHMSYDNLIQKRLMYKKNNKAIFEKGHTEKVYDASWWEGVGTHIEKTQHIPSGANWSVNTYTMMKGRVTAKMKRFNLYTNL